MFEKALNIFKNKKLLISVIAVVLVISASVGASFAFLKKESDAHITNTFKSASGVYDVSVVENFNGTVKKNVTAKNNGNTPVYIRISLLSYRVNSSGDRIGGKSSVPTFDIGNGWFLQDGFYVYSKPVSAGESAPYLIGNDGITLKGSYDDDDGGKQAIDVLAETFDSTRHKDQIKSAWNVNIASDGTLSLKS